MANYQAVYSRRDYVNSRTNQRFETADIENAQRDVDNKINSAYRSHLGNFDVNGYRIALPLSGTYDVIDDYTKTVQLALDDELKAIADDMVIAKLEHDFSENAERLPMSEEALQAHLVEHFGAVSSRDLDFTSDFLRQNKITTTSGKYLNVIGTGKVLAIHK